ncbi:MAG: hypothetical protein MUF87_15800 [Anaerolineae bacterium]|jgi:hypothetical protein|nr:hypothetical protein [Anaerolineae bacterium]
MSNDRARALAFKETIESKIRGLIEEFAEGKISREQFHVIYEKYNAQLSIANHALMSGNPDAVSIAQGGPPTIAIRDAHMARAKGLLIYHNLSRKTLETLGEFDVPMASIQATLDEFTASMKANRLLERRLVKISDKIWLMVSPGRFTTSVTLFQNQPAEQQSREIERLHRDFEEANRAALERGAVDGSKLAYPFLAFIKKKYTQPQ